MRKSIFRKLADKYDGKFYFQDENYPMSDGSYTPNVIYLVKFTYKNCEVSVLNTTGKSYEANITCKLPNDIQVIPFEITPISHFKNLFLRRKKLLTVKTKNENISYFLEKNNALIMLNKLALKDNYSPWIVCSKKTNSIVTKYHLEFDNWTEALEPTVQLYIDLIDEFEKGITNLNHSQYRESITETKHI